jgi:hypothetical protein
MVMAAVAAKSFAKAKAKAKKPTRMKWIPDPTSDKAFCYESASIWGTACCASNTDDVWMESAFTSTGMASSPQLKYILHKQDQYSLAAGEVLTNYTISQDVPAVCSATAIWSKVSDLITVSCSSTASYIKIIQDGKWVPDTPEDRLKTIIDRRLAPYASRRSNPLPPPKDFREICARETLRRVIGDRKFQKFLSHGFVSVRAPSGKVYQIFPGHGLTNVYKDGQKIERLCVVLFGDFPPTDSVIMRFLLILNDEEHFRGLANKSQFPEKAQLALTTDQRRLTEVFKELKKQLAA